MQIYHVFCQRKVSSNLCSLATMDLAAAGNFKLALLNSLTVLLFQDNKVLVAQACLEAATVELQMCGN